MILPLCSGLVIKALSKVHEETFFSDRVRNVSQQVTSCILLCTVHCSSYMKGNSGLILFTQLVIKWKCQEGSGSGVIINVNKTIHKSNSEWLNFSVKFYSWLSESKSVLSANGGSVLVFWIARFLLVRKTIYSQHFCIFSTIY
jgi:hypothetical protein